LKIHIKNSQKKYVLNLPALRKLAARLAEELEKADPQTRWDEVVILVTDDAGMIRYHQEFFGKGDTTDVISFRSDPIPGEEGASGDLIVNVECAVREGPSHDGADLEFAFYMAHGFDHLSGSEDHTPAKRAAMHQTEKGWLRAMPSSMFHLIRLNSKSK